jgi:CubicO group peptidase (beta-lactamase class C family)
MTSFLVPTLAARLRAHPAADFEQLRHLVHEHALKEKMPGISIAVAANGRIVFSEAFGMADLENRVAATSQSVYRLCSISKALTAVAALQLAETRKLDLDACIPKYLPEAPQTWRSITPRQLLSHTSGIRHYKNDAEEFQTKHYQNLNEALGLFCEDSLLFKPGTSVQYSTFGYTLLGVVIERASGQPFRDYMRIHVFGPSGMNHSRDDDIWQVVPNRVRGYRNGEDGLHLNCRLEDPSYKIPGGGMLATAEDVVRFALAVRNCVLLRKESVSELFTRYIGPNGHRLGLGWDIEDFNGLKVVGHSGGGEGFITDFRMFPDSGVAGAALANNEDGRFPPRTFLEPLLAGLVEKS